MAFQIAPAFIPQLAQTVSINGRIDNRIECAHISQGCGSGTTKATFRCPQFLFETVADAFKDMPVQVYVQSGNDYTGYADFVGYLPSHISNLTPEDDSASFEAVTITAFFAKVYVGQATGLYDVVYRFRDPVTLAPTGLTPIAVLKAVFAGLPDDFGVCVSLGDTSPLEDFPDLPTDIIFRNATIAGAIEQILALFGDVSYTERFTGGGVVLDFLRASDPRASSFPMDIGGNIQQISRNSTSVDLITRVLAGMDTAVFMITCVNNADSEPVWEKRLIEDWNPDYEAAALADPSVISDDSRGCGVLVTAARSPSDTSFTVLAPCAPWVGSVFQNPIGGEVLVVAELQAREGGDPANGYRLGMLRGQYGTTAADVAINDSLLWLMPGIGDVFRRFRLPEVMRGYVKDKDLPLEKPAGEAYRTQCYQYGRTMVPYVSGGDPADLVGAVNAKPTLLKGVHFKLDENYFVLREPAVNCTRSTVSGDGKTNITLYEKAHVGITFAYRSGRPQVDSGVIGNGNALPFTTAGLTLRFLRDELEWAQITNKNFPIGGYEWNCLYFPQNGTYPDGVTRSDYDETTPLAIEVPVMAKDDSALLLSAVRQVVRERQLSHASYTVTIPYFCRAAKVGKRLEVSGVTLPYEGALCITQVEHELGSDHSTTLTVDNVKPPKRMSVKIKRHRESTAEDEGGTAEAPVETEPEEAPEPEAAETPEAAQPDWEAPEVESDSAAYD